LIRLSYPQDILKTPHASYFYLLPGCVGSRLRQNLFYPSQETSYYFLDKIEVIFIFSIVKMRMHLRLAQNTCGRNEFNAKREEREIV